MQHRFPMSSLAIWAPDPLEKIFQHSERPQRAPRVVALEAARGEVVSGQIALRVTGITHQHYATSGCGIDSVTADPLERIDGNATPIPVECRWVGYTYVPRAAGGVDPERLDGQAPGLYPDPLYPVYATQTNPHHYNPDHSMTLASGRTQALWLTVRVPRDAAPGDYQGAVAFTLSYFGNTVRVPIRLRLYAAMLPSAPTCGMENWFVLASVARQHECEWFSERFWQLTEAYLRNMADHRQTHIVVPMYELIRFHPDHTGGLHLDWSRFDRFVAMAFQAGLHTLSGNHLATYTYDGHRYRCGVHAFRASGATAQYTLYEGRTPQARRWLAWFLPRLRDHLAERGWLAHWWQHLRDEPAGIREDYQAIVAAVREYAPEFRTIDALDGHMVEQCDCWTPQLGAWGENYDFFRERQAAGDQVWTYVCCGPVGRYANRFIDQRTVLPRLLFWIMARYGATGYLHWGYNWAAALAPELDTCWFMPAQGPVPSGDVCLVYPGPHGPHDSIRWEMQREGIQEYELFRLLAARNPRRAQSILSKIIHDFDDYTTETSAFRTARRALLACLSHG